MRRLPLALTSALLVLACGDDGTPQDPTVGSSTSGEADSTTADPPVTSTTDEPETTTAATSTGLDSSTGPAAGCGNGIIEDGEECDDENVLDDDACSSICTVPFEELWTVTYDGGDADFGSHVLLDPEGNVYVLGNVEVDGQDDLWLRQYTADGREGWTWTYDGEFHDDDFGRRMAWLDGDLVIVGTEATELGGDDVLILRLATADQTVVWSQQIDGTGMGPEAVDNADFGDSIFVDADGNVLVSATTRVDGQEYDMWLRKLDPDGVEIWTVEYDNPDFHGSDATEAVLSDAAGDIYLVGTTEVAPSMNESWVRKLDTDGNELWTQAVPDVIFTNGSLGADGNLVLVGLDASSKNGNIWVGKYDSEFAELGTTTADGPGQYDLGLAAVAGASGDVYVTGFITVLGEQSNIWVGRYASDLGLRWWSDGYGNTESMLTDDGRGVAVSDDESRVVVVGYESVIGEDTNIWVRMYQNNPSPKQ